MDEQERLAKTLNEAAQTGSSCAGCYLGLMLLAALPFAALAAWAIVGAGTGSEELGMVAAAVVGGWLLVTVARLTGWGR